MQKQRPQPNNEKLVALLEQLELLTGEKLELNFNSLYGGYRLIKREGTTQIRIFGTTDERRITYNEMTARLRGLIDGLLYSKRNINI